MRISTAGLYYAGPGLFRGVVAFGVLPLSTRILGPGDYGIFAVAMTLSQLCVSLAMSGAEYLIYGSFKGGDDRERKMLLSTTFWVSSAIATLLAVVVAMGGGMVLQLLDVAQPPSWTMHWLIPFFVVGSIPWSYGVLVTVVQGRARVYAYCTMVATTTAAVGLLVALFAFDAGGSALFVGAATGIALTVPFGLYVLRPHLAAKVSWYWLHELWRVAPAAVLKHGAERGYEAVERTTVAAAAGVHDAGLYSHAQQYRDLVAMIVKAVAYALWPISLHEARSPRCAFKQTLRAWALVYAMLGAGGIAFAFIGEPLIRVLTHDKFTQAYPLVVGWFVYIILQNTAKPAMATVHVHTGAGRAYQNIGTVSSLVGVAAVLWLVPVVGMYGAAVAAVVRVIVFRIATIRLARKFADVISEESAPLLAMFFILAALFIRGVAAPNLSAEMALFVVLEGAFLWTVRGPVRDFVRLLRGGGEYRSLE